MLRHGRPAHLRLGQPRRHQRAAQRQKESGRAHPARRRAQRRICRRGGKAAARQSRPFRRHHRDCGRSGFGGTYVAGVLRL